MTKVLLIEDDASLGQSLFSYLSQEGFEVKWVSTLAEARREADRLSVGTLVLDWMFPDGQGIDFLREVRANGIKTPVIMLTARNDLVDKVLGLETGANDYMTKPFEPRELVARIRVQHRAALSVVESRSSKIRAGAIEMDLETRMVLSNGEKVEMSKMEFSLLKLLCENPNKVFSREELLNRVWGFENFPTTRTVDTHILQLRQKLGETLFETVRGVGYRFVMDSRP